MFWKKNIELNTIYNLKNLEILMGVQHTCHANARTIKALQKETVALKGESVRHRKCEVCGILGHEPEMTLVHRPSLPGMYDWIHNTCLHGSEYERRKDKRNEAQEDITNNPETPQA